MTTTCTVTAGDTVNACQQSLTYFQQAIAQEQQQRDTSQQLWTTYNNTLATYNQQHTAWTAALAAFQSAWNAARTLTGSQIWDGNTTIDCNNVNTCHVGSTTLVYNCNDVPNSQCAKCTACGYNRCSCTAGLEDYCGSSQCTNYRYNPNYASNLQLTTVANSPAAAVAVANASTASIQAQLLSCSSACYSDPTTEEGCVIQCQVTYAPQLAQAAGTLQTALAAAAAAPGAKVLNNVTWASALASWNALNPEPVAPIAPTMPQYYLDAWPTFPNILCQTCTQCMAFSGLSAQNINISQLQQSCVNSIQQSQAASAAAQQAAAQASQQAAAAAAQQAAAQVAQVASAQQAAQQASQAAQIAEAQVAALQTAAVKPPVSTAIPASAALSAPSTTPASSNTMTYIVILLIFLLFVIIGIIIAIVIKSRSQPNSNQ